MIDKNLHNVWINVRVTTGDEWVTVAKKMKSEGYRTSGNMLNESYHGNKMVDFYDYYVCLQMSNILPNKDNSVSTYAENINTTEKFLDGEHEIIFTYDEFMKLESIEKWKNEYVTSHRMGLL